MNWTVLKKMISRYQQYFTAALSLLFMALLIRIFISKKEYLAQLDWQIFSEQWYFIPVLFMMVWLNWMLEAKKWQLITANSSLWDSLKIVLTGLLFKQFIPFGLGELSGRILADNHTGKLEATGAFMLVGFVQFSISVLFGTFGFFWLAGQTSFRVASQFTVLLVVTILTIAVSLIWYKKIATLYRKWFDKIRNVSRKNFYRLVLLSAGRYLVYFIQSVIIYYLFNSAVPLSLIAAGISFVFLAKTIVPSVGFIGDLGIRGFSAVLFFSYFDVQTLPVILAGFSVWVINIFLPSFVALFLMRKLSFYSKV
ncbi:MAG: lysylphosphatidylglycerol synthase domain-containing protein [Cyclobacteriaceae bacterium]